MLLHKLDQVPKHDLVIVAPEPTDSCCWRSKLHKRNMAIVMLFGILAGATPAGQA